MKSIRLYFTYVLYKILNLYITRLAGISKFCCMLLAAGVATVLNKGTDHTAGADHNSDRVCTVCLDKINLQSKKKYKYFTDFIVRIVALWKILLV